MAFTTGNGAGDCYQQEMEALDFIVIICPMLNKTRAALIGTCILINNKLIEESLIEILNSHFYTKLILFL